jgi:hypothetical protein
MQSGIGPFVGVFLQAHGWASGLIGTAMTLGNVAGMLITTPIGGFIDALVLASLIILVSQIWAVAASQIATSIAGVAIVPAVTGITLGMVKLQPAERPQPGLQSRRQHGRCGGVRLSRLALRLYRRFSTCCGFWRDLHCLCLDDSQAGHRQPCGAWQGRRP